MKKFQKIVSISFFVALISSLLVWFNMIKDTLFGENGPGSLVSVVFTIAPWIMLISFLGIIFSASSAMKSKELWFGILLYILGFFLIFIWFLWFIFITQGYLL